VVAVDDGYVLPALISLYSARASAASDFRVLVFYDPNYLCEKNRDFLAMYVSEIGGPGSSLMPINLPRELPTKGHLNEMAFARLFIPEVLRTDFVWLDADTLLRSGWDQILQFDSWLENAVPIAAVRTGFDTAADFDAAAKRNQAMQVSKMGYFNSGVMVVNYERWASGRFEDRARALIGEYEDRGFDWADQCVLNFLCEGKQTDINPIFNMMDYRGENARIFHFNGDEKPWKPKSLSLGGITRFGPYYSEYVSAWRQAARQALLVTSSPSLEGDRHDARFFGNPHKVSVARACMKTLFVALKTLSGRLGRRAFLNR